MSLEVLGSFLLSVAAIITAISALRKAKVDYSAGIVTGFSALLESYTKENKRLTDNMIAEQKEHTDEIKGLHEKYGSDIKKLHEKYQGDITGFREEIRTLEKTVSDQGKTIIRQANQIQLLEGNKS